MIKNNSAIVSTVESDIKRIDNALTCASEEDLKTLHVELDGTYQNLIKNWGTGVYGYNKNYGFHYEFLNESSLRDNLVTFKGKLRGYLLEMTPEFAQNKKVNVGNKETGKKAELLKNYAEIKQMSPGNMAISIDELSFSKYKDTLEYLVGHEFIQCIDETCGIKIYFKLPSFDTFSEHILLEEIEDNTMETQKFDNKKVFIVHGHDETLKYKVSNWLWSIGLEPIILHLKANCGITTIMNKIKTNSDVRCAIVLMTADDVGKAKADPELKFRARQNVVFEAGYFIGKLGEDRVIMLYDEGIEAPGDLAGCVYIPADEYDGWKEQVRREFSAMGIEYTV